MTARILSAIALLAGLSACGGGETGSNSAAPAAPVKAAAAPAGQNWTEVVSKTPEGGYRMGNPDAPIKLVEYGSRTCPTCGSFAREGFKPLTEQYVATGKVSFEFRDFLVHGAPDLAAAVTGACGGTAPFFPILEQMYANQQATLEVLEKTPAAFQEQLQGASPARIATAWAERLGYDAFVKQRGIPDAKLKQCLADETAINDATKATEAAMQSNEVSGTPTFIINGEVQQGIVSWQQLETALKAAGA